MPRRLCVRLRIGGSPDRELLLGTSGRSRFASFGEVHIFEGDAASFESTDPNTQCGDNVADGKRCLIPVDQDITINGDVDVVARGAKLRSQFVGLVVNRNDVAEVGAAEV